MLLNYNKQAKGAVANTATAHNYLIGGFL